MSEQWIQQVQQKMAGYRKSAPEVSWEELDQALAASKNHKTHRLWLKRMAVAAVLLLVVSIGYWSFLHNNDAHSPQTASTTVNQTRTVDVHHEGAHDLSQHQNQGESPVLQKTLARKYNVVEASASESETVIPVSTVNNDVENAAPVEEEERPHAVEKKAMSEEPTRSAVSPAVFHQQKFAESRLTAQVYMSSTMLSSTMRYADSFNQQNFLISCSSSSTQDYAQTEPNIHHHQPVRLGFSLRYRLDDRWSVESGLSYTRLSSDITMTANARTIVTQQRLDYIGVPLNISHNLWNNHNFGLYVTAGGMIEKRVDASPWQLSLNGAAGAEYKLTNRFSLYAEPGLSYYFSDGSSTPTIYQDYPLNFNLSFGLRFNLK